MVSGFRIDSSSAQKSGQLHGFSILFGVMDMAEGMDNSAFEMAFPFKLAIIDRASENSNGSKLTAVHMLYSDLTNN